MATIATVSADTWSISIGSGWIVLMLTGMGLCFAFMLGFMWLMRDGRGWAMCGRWWQQATPPTDIGTSAADETADRTAQPEGSARP